MTDPKSECEKVMNAVLPFAEEMLTKHREFLPFGGSQTGALKATALVYDILTVPPGKEDKQNAIAIALDHRDNYSVIVIFPYSFTTDDQLVIETPVAMQGKNKIFSQQAG